MAINHTTNYQLCQWEATDKVLRTDFNQDNQKIDAALAALSESAGNCHIQMGSYTGTGEYGEDAPNSLTFDFEPKLIFMDVGTCYTVNQYPMYFIFQRGVDMAAGPGSKGSGNQITWSGHSVTWYSPSTPEKQFNKSGTEYLYIALG